MKKGDLVMTSSQAVFYRTPTPTELVEWRERWDRVPTSDGEPRLDPRLWRGTRPERPVVVLAARVAPPPGLGQRGWCQVLDPATGLPMWVLRASCVVV
jgi:hypothetical protein